MAWANTCRATTFQNSSNRAPDTPEGQYAVKIVLDEADQSKFPIGAQGSAAIYTGGERGAWAALRKISIRAHAWASWFYPLNL